MYGEIISDVDETVNPKSASPDIGRRTSKTPPLPGEVVTVWQTFPFNNRFCMPKLPTSSVSNPQSETPSAPTSKRKPMLGFERTVSTENESTVYEVPEDWNLN